MSAESRRARWRISAGGMLGWRLLRGGCGARNAVSGSAVRELSN
jgi:hypothetical protein